MATDKQTDKQVNIVIVWSPISHFVERRLFEPASNDSCTFRENRISRNTTTSYADYKLSAV